MNGRSLACSTGGRNGTHLASSREIFPSPTLFSAYQLGFGNNGLYHINQVVRVSYKLALTPAIYLMLFSLNRSEIDLIYTCINSN